MTRSVPNNSIIVTSKNTATSTSPADEPTTSATPGAPNPASKNTSNTKSIVGGIVGGLGGAALLALGGFLLWRKLHPSTRNSEAGLPTQTVPFPYETSSYEPSQDPATAMAHASSRSFGLISRKEIETLLGEQSMPGLTAPSSTNLLSVGATSSQGPSATRSDPSTARSDLQDLRTELEGLRQMMRTLRDGGLESPPAYRSELGD